MNLEKLFQMQKELDDRILAEHPIQEGEDRLAKKILALLVELGELANEWREFKYWSNDQKPRTGMLEEYVDALHFILSIGLDIAEPGIVNLRDVDGEENIIEQFIEVFDRVRGLYFFEYDIFEYESLLAQFIKLGEMLGFTWEQIEKAYLEKNKINHERQESDY